MASEEQQAVGIVGLGIIGSRVACRLGSAGFATYTWNRSPREEPNQVSSLTELAKAARWIQIFVTDGAAVCEVVQAMRPELTSSHCLLVHATVHPHEMQRAAALADTAGACLLDAPFTGSRDAAAAGELCYYVAGDETVVEQVRPLLEVTAREVIHMGRLGNASILKIATNMITASTVEALAEALALVRSCGLDGRSLELALQNNACRSALLDMKLPAMLGDDFAPRFSLKNMAKDAGIALAMAAEKGLAFPVLEGAAGALHKAGEQGCEEQDFSVVARTFAAINTPRQDDQR